MSYPRALIFILSRSSHPASLLGVRRNGSRHCICYSLQVEHLWAELQRLMIGHWPVLDCLPFTQRSFRENERKLNVI